MSNTVTQHQDPWATRTRDFIHLDWVIVLVLAYGVLLAVISVAVFIFAEGRELRMETEPRLVWDIRGLIEIVFFASQIGIAILAVVALNIARKHADHMGQRTEEAVKARKATVYMEINSRYSSPSITYSRLKLVYFMELHESQARTEPVDEFVHTKLRAMYDRAYTKFYETQAGECEYTRTLRLLSFLEDLGLLVEKGYVDPTDILDFMSGVVGLAETTLRAHIIWRRQQENDSALYANALRLMKRASSFTPTLFDEGSYQLNSATSRSG